MTAPQYNPNVPRPGDSIATSQPDFLNNFMALFNAFSTNHVDLENALVGKHTIVELTAQDTNFLSNAGEISVYSRLIEEEGTQVFLKYQGTTEEFQFSCYQIYSIPPIPLQFNGTQTIYFTFLPGRVLLYFGVYSNSISNLFEQSPLTLIPPVAIDVITMDFCVSGSTPSLKPTAAIVKENNDIISKIKLGAPSSLGSIPGPIQYLVMAKI